MKEKQVPYIRSDGSEKVNYDRDDFPVLLRKNTFDRNYRPSNAKSHWHYDVEFIAVIDGSIRYNVNGDVFRISAGEGLFVNSQQFHYILSDEGGYCRFYCVILHPMLLCSSHRVEERFVIPVLTNECLPYLILRDNIKWQADILQNIGRIYEVSESNTAELQIQQLFLELWQVLYENTSEKRDNVIATNHQLSVLKNMITYIHGHYWEKTTLDDICRAGGIGKTSCTTIFKEYVRCTPIAFLTEFRLQKAIELLRETDMSITEIAYATGFSGASYFSECFKNSFGCSPREYRENV